MFRKNITSLEDEKVNRGEIKAEGNSPIITAFYIFLAFLTWFTVNLKFGIISDLIQNAFLKGSGVTPILTFATYPSSILVTIYAFYQLRHVTRYSIIYAISVPIFAIVVFEILWHVFGIFSDSYPYTVNTEGYIIFFGWIFLGSITYRFWNINKFTVILLSVYIAFWIWWVVEGYPQILNGSILSYFFNFILKILTFVLIGSLFYSVKKNKEVNKMTTRRLSQ